jgi:hypothetical protein
MTDPSPVIFGIIMSLILSALVTLAYFMWEDMHYISVPVNGYDCKLVRASNNESGVCTEMMANRIKGYRPCLAYENLGGRTVSILFEKVSA